MESVFYRLQFESASKNWWYKGREAIVRKLISHYLKDKKEVGLDAGCGPGTNIPILQDICDKVFSADMSSEAGECVKKRFNIPFIACDIQNLPFKDELFDMILALDIIEHLDKPEDAIKMFERTLKTGGLLIVTVPAFQFLWGTHDVLAWHKKRYRAGELIALFRRSKFKIVFYSYFNFFLFIPTTLAKLIVDRVFPKSVPKAGLYRPPVIHFFLKMIMEFESLFFPYISFPFGTSIVCILRNKDER